MAEAIHISEDDENDPRSDKRVGIRLSMAMGAAGMGDRALGAAIGLSHETIRRTRRGDRSARQIELRKAARALTAAREIIEREIDEDLEAWLQHGPSYNGGPTRPAPSAANPRYIKPQADPVTNVIDLDAARRRRDQGRTAHSL